jgi:hypothetical protein
VKNGATLDDLLVVEDDPYILEFKCAQTGVLLWPLIRMAVLRMMMSDLLYGTPLVGSGRRPPGLRAARTLARSIFHNAIHVQLPRPICLMASAEAMTWLNAKWFNRLSDHFALARGNDTLVIEDQFGWNWPFPRQFENVYLHAPILALGSAAGRAMRRSAHDKTAAALIGLVTQRARTHLGWEPGEARVKMLLRSLSRQAAATPTLYRAYTALFERIGCRVLIKEMGCYGHSAVAICAAKAMQIVTAEYQHGAVSAGHDAYNYSPLLRQEGAYRRTLPDYFLGYGRWWNQQTA